MSTSARRFGLLGLLLTGAVIGSVPGSLLADPGAEPRKQIESTTAGEWPQWRGPHRTAVSSETGLRKTWPAQGPPLVWKADHLGAGYSTPSVAGGRVVGLGDRGADEVVWAIDAHTGRELWHTRIAGTNREIELDPNLPRRGGRQPLGTRLDPRSTPAIDGDRVYALGIMGDLVCLHAASGTVVWRRHLVDDLGGSIHYHGYAESPLLDGEKLIVTPGGPDCTLVALDKSTGNELWRTRIPGDRSHYSSAIVADFAGRRMYLQFLERSVVGVDARDGRLLWRVERPTGPTYSIATPLFHDGRVLTSETNSGGLLVQLTAVGDGLAAAPVYSTQRLRNQHGGMVLVDGFVYGFNNDILTCLNWETGDIAWTARSVGKGSLIYADGHLYIRGERGAVALAEATPTGYVEKSRFNPPRSRSGQAWSHPVIAAGRLYLRDQDLLLCYDLQASDEAP